MPKPAITEKSWPTPSNPATTFPAFTLVEMLVVLLISGLLLGIVYASLRAVEHRFQLFLADGRRQASFSTVRTLLQRDSERARTLTAVPRHLTADFGTHTVEYLFLDSTLVRQQPGSADTFALPTDSLAFYWQQRPVIGTGPVDAFGFRVRSHGEAYLFNYEKTYDAQMRWEMQQKSTLAPTEPDAGLPTLNNNPR